MNEFKDTIVLTHEDLAHIFETINIKLFWQELLEQMKRVVLDERIREYRRYGLIRSGRGTEKFDTVEIMLCSANDLTCVKQIASYPSTRKNPTVMGTIIITSTTNAQRPILVCDATLLTPLRTAASTALVAVKTAKNAKSLGVIGAGLEGQSHALALLCLMSDLEQINLADTLVKRSVNAARTLRAMAQTLELNHVVINDAGNNARLAACSDIVVTATYGLEPVLYIDWLKNNGNPFLACVGSDLPGKGELADDIYPYAKFIVDDRDQCALEGELQHAKIELGEELQQEGRVITVAELLRNSSAFKERPERVIVYDSTGLARQDLAIARVILNYTDIIRKYSRPWSPHGKPDLSTLIGYCNRVK